MSSAKKSSLKCCRKCGVLLTPENLKEYDKKHSNYICIPCRKAKDKHYYQTVPEYAIKQQKRYQMRKSAVIFSYGDRCAQCGEDEYDKLTIDHVNDNGNKDRQNGFVHIIDYLYNNTVQRDGYQVLCYNCNCSKNVVYKDKYALRNKKIVMEKYGEWCAQCGESRIERLTIDHKNNDGAERRRKYQCGTGAQMYRWLIKNNFPTDLGLQVLCFNCNCSKIALAKLPKDDQILAGINALKASVFDGSTSESAVSRSPDAKLL